MSDETTTERPKPAVSELQTVTDSLGRTLTLRKLDALAELDLIEAAGPNAANRQWMINVTLASTVAAIDGTPCRPATKRDHLREQVKRVGNEGIAAVIQAFSVDVGDDAEEPAEADTVAVAKN